MPSENARTRRFPLLLNKAEHERYTEFAKDQGVSLGSLIRQALEEKIAETPKKKKRAA